jgi:hypothetical protein
MSSWEDLVLAVRERAADRCEYCQMHQSLQGATFHMEHILPGSLGGPTTVENLAWCCPSCNLKKAARIEVLDSQGGQTVRLFHPRKDRWSDHFQFDELRLIGLTAIGRATAAALGFNDPRRMLIRNAEARLGLFPPE